MAQLPRVLENPQDYRFDLGYEARQILHDYPQLDGHTVFVSTEAPEVLHGGTQDLPDRYLPLLPSYVESCIERALEKNTSMAYADNIIDRQTGGAFPLKVVVLIPTPASPHRNIERERGFRDFFVLNHEAGHLLLPYDSGDGLQPYPFTECLADAFATIRAVQKFGADTAIYDRLGAMRSVGFMLSGNVRHLTTTVTSRIMEDAQRRDFSLLDPDKTMRASKKYALAFTPRPGDLARAEQSYSAIADYMRGNTAVDKLQLLGLICNTSLSTADRFSFYLGAKFFQPMLHPGGAALAQNDIFLDPALRDALIDQFAARSKDFRLDALAAQFMENKSDATTQKLQNPPLLAIAAPHTIRPLRR